VYDEPEFVIRNIWRYYGGWWDGNPSRLKPAGPGALASELAALIGGVEPLVARAELLSSAGDHRLACELIELAAQADSQNRRVHEVRAAIYGDRRSFESSLMAKGIFGAAAADSASRLQTDEA
jgi:alkyl sulfatase BDS1-like metallo-beta-lactamase superfamily hydrolase